MSLCVFIGHARDLGAENSTFWAHFISDQAVNIFFLISGGLILKSAQRLNVSSFILHRLMRIYPGLICVTLVCSFVLAPVVASHTHGIWTLAGALTNVLTSLTCFPGIATGLESALPDSFRNVSWNPPLWTLFFEMSCYAGVLFVVKLAQKWIYAFLILMFLLCSLIYSVSHNPDMTFIHTSSRLTLAFVTGGLMYGTKSCQTSLLLGSYALIPLIWGEFFPLMVVSLAIALFEVPRFINLSVPPLQVDLSYGIYIWHWPLLQFVSAISDGNDSGQVWGNETMVVVLLAPAIALVQWYVIESPSIRFARLLSQRWSNRF